MKVKTKENKVILEMNEDEALRLIRFIGAGTESDDKRRLKDDGFTKGSRKRITKTVYKVLSKLENVC